MNRLAGVVVFKCSTTIARQEAKKSGVAKTTGYQRHDIEPQPAIHYSSIMAFRGMDLGRYKFDTIFHDGSVVHKRPLARVSDKTWRRKHKIGAGAFGDLWLEQEDESGQLRAVKDRLKSHFNPEEILVMVAMNDVTLHNPTRYPID